MMNLSVREFHREMQKFGGFEKRDFDLVVHGDLKWKQFAKYLKFKGKRAIDIGCHIGIVSIRAKAKGAKFVWGIDIREDVQKFNEEFRKKLKMFPSIQFLQEDLKSIEFPTVKPSIVLCLGVIHKFPGGEYQKMVAKLCDICGETLVLETTFNYAGKPDLKVTYNKNACGGLWPYHSRIAKPYLKKLLADNGFSVTREIPSVVYASHERETWIAERN